MFSRETAPEPGNRFRLRLRLRCVRAKLRVRDVSAVAGCGLVEKPGRPPSLRPGLGRLVLCWLVNSLSPCLMLDSCRIAFRCVPAAAFHPPPVPVVSSVC